jgi:hypothetical protein
MDLTSKGTIKSKAGHLRRMAYQSGRRSSPEEDEVVVGGECLTVAHIKQGADVSEAKDRVGPAAATVLFPTWLDLRLHVTMAPQDPEKEGHARSLSPRLPDASASPTSASARR